ncbi:peptidyl-tRNA hydrolase-domain-containing protein [Radiomyces spectabilis]|uniref:peptidyl-tRNA hydrolase-domain-containing protein n=1 Tax=Radiomyces spectabilis TaxID=64574 RepID=UPI00222067B0|nr:peptidyl-tRNA hydrolase-domain-containing protein [Radiomyces spectabilis]KAI8365349.1 peptidyl-tRNA hydrolase-domain-containing protein [Radiomyces spectabilis]
MHSKRVLLVGLGNYIHTNTRHNVGMMMLDHVASKLNLTWTLHRAWKAHMAQTQLTIQVTKNKESHYEDISLILLKPRLLMNVCGPSVAKAVRELSIPASEIYVFHDDMERVLGKLSIKTGGSANGHNGVKSVIQSLRTNEFKRVRIGIGRPPTDAGNRSPDIVADYVLSKFTPSEMDTLMHQVYPLMDIGPGLGLETLCGRGELWQMPKPAKPKKVVAQKPVSPTPPEQQVTSSA